jgi:hypothetical protein
MLKKQRFFGHKNESAQNNFGIGLNLSIGAARRAVISLAENPLWCFIVEENVMPKRKASKPKPQDLFELAGDPRFISGIYNYCDRWCERCAFTARCLVYAQEEEERNDPASSDLNNEAFWKKLGEIFEQTLAMLDQMAKERGLDLSEVEAASAARQQRNRQKRETAESHELAKKSEEYATMADAWMEAEHEIFEQKRDELIALLELEIGGRAQHAEAARIKDALEVIRWYQHQIHVKLMRALMKFDREAAPEDEAFPKDSDGSAKVALIGMDRSLAAWGALREHFPEKTDTILTLLLQLDRLRRKTEQYFPNARRFKRPGFDD